ncbi:hypothetical protein HYPSUDRAFT_91242 [Hypholoma sublateritium FD-334 SS-4]|uniref:Uncharacterized protein n=1 Tax=Hypholoma sublateritium (strain FD-334 SS-4) TaxID=945553 RepID=A0A0D2KPH0_HYPSF|nr:hypothetical protein HYPSUDRAFT_91242 [Hypholoma sublateritium FD-334 SS-4]
MREPPAPTLSEYRFVAIDLPVSMSNVCASHATCASFFIAVRLRPPTTFYECIRPPFYTTVPSHVPARSAHIFADSCISKTRLMRMHNPSDIHAY